MTGAHGNQVVTGGCALRTGGGVLEAPPLSEGEVFSKVLVNGSLPRLNMAAVPPTTGAVTPLQPGMQIMNMRPPQGHVLQPQQVRSLAPRMILSQQMIQNVRPGQPAVSAKLLIIKFNNVTPTFKTRIGKSLQLRPIH